MRLDQVVAQVKDHALGYPEAWEDHPWDETVVKVRKKVFVFLGETGMSVKLPESKEAALTLAYTSPTGYGLGKAGWVSVNLDQADLGEIDVDLLLEWVDESYRAVAPKTLVKQLDAPA